MSQPAATGGTAASAGADSVGARDHGRPQTGTPAAGSPPAPKRRADEFDKAALRRRKEPSPLNALTGFPFDRLVSAAAKLASRHLPSARIQHVELMVVAQAPALKVSFHDAGLERWYAVRLSQGGETLWEGHELTGPDAPRWPTVADLSALEIPLPDLLDWLGQQVPEGRFDFVGLQVCDGGRLVWLAQNTQAFESEPVVEVDGHDGEATLFRFDRAAGRHLPAP